MKEKFKMEDRHWVLVLLFALLTTMVMVTAHLYAQGSNLEGWEKDFGSYLIGGVFEIGIFVCIKAGSRVTGYVFAIFSFFFGVLHEDKWGKFLKAAYSKDWEITQLPDHTLFLSSTGIRLAAAILVLVLTERYVRLLKEHRKAQNGQFSVNTQVLKEQKELIEINEQILSTQKHSISTLEKEESTKRALLSSLETELRSERAKKGKEKTLNGHNTIAD